MPSIPPQSYLYHLGFPGGRSAGLREHLRLAETVMLDGVHRGELLDLFGVARTTVRRTIVYLRDQAVIRTVPGREVTSQSAHPDWREPCGTPATATCSQDRRQLDGPRASGD
jgi:transcription initiation factor IIE alpha subunit